MSQAIPRLKRALIAASSTAIEHLDPSNRCLWGVSDQVPAGSLICVYRRSNTPTVEALVAQARSLDWTVALWALDDVAGSLGPHTVGHGPGSRFALLNKLVTHLAPEPNRWVVVADDDVVVPEPGLGRLVSLAAHLGLGLAQPAHGPRSMVNHGFTRRRAASIARLTNFVEIGPVVAIAPAWRARVVPFPEDVGMGWGLELTWSDLRRDGCRLGIIDAVSMRHLSAAGTGYDASIEKERTHALLDERGVASMKGYQSELVRWRPWQRRAPAGFTQPGSTPQGG